MRGLKCIHQKAGLLLLDYEQGWMTPEAAQAFEQDHLAHCAACRESLAFFKPVWARLRTRPELLKEAERRASEKTGWRMPRWPLWSPAAAAALAVLVLAVGILTYRHFLPPGISDYARLATEEDWELIRYRGGAASESPLVAAQRSFEAGKYMEAVDQLKAIIAKDPTDKAALFYLGLTYLRLGQDPEAVAVLGALVEQSYGLIRERSRWNLANAYLKLGDPVHSREQLQILMREAALYPEYRAQAEALIQKMDELQKVK